MMGTENQNPDQETDAERAGRHIMTGGWLDADIESVTVSISDAPSHTPADSQEPATASLDRKVEFTGIILSQLSYVEFIECPVLIVLYESERRDAYFLNELDDRVIGHAVTVPQPGGTEPLIEIKIPATPKMIDEWVQVAYQIGQSKIGRIRANIGVLGIEKNKELDWSTETSFWITHLKVDVKFPAGAGSS